MISAPKPTNEKERLQALYRYRILDTEAEQVFDDLTKLACEICETPIALISLVDSERQWFKSKLGIDAQETGRDIAFCSHAIHQDEVFEIPDTHNDKRFKDNPLVVEDPNIRFYAGMPLKTPDGFKIGTLCAISNIPKKLKQHQISALKTLGREVISQLELRLKIRQLEALSAYKTKLLSNVSHELRTPLNAIMVFCQLMMNDTDNIVSSQHATYLRHMNYSSNRLLDLVNSMLDLHELASGEMRLHEGEVDIARFMDAMRGLTQQLAQENKVHVAFNLVNKKQETLIVDEAKLSQITLNLISNAIKFSGAGQSVTIDFSLNKSTLLLAVKDSGTGMSESDKADLFSEKNQFSSTKEKDGLGLGLAITKSLVDLMKGKILVNSQEGKGTLVKVSIPLTEKLEAACQPEIRSLTPTFDKSLSILVVEDNDINQEVAKAIFKSIGVDIEIAESGEKALELVKSNRYAIIFMDIQLPGIDGFETSLALRKDHPEQVIVALSADVFVQQDERLVKSGMLGSLEKPIEITSLISILNHFCSSSTSSKISN